LFQGFLEKLGNSVTKWKKRWFRLTAKQLDYFVSDSERDRKGSIAVTTDFKPEVSDPWQYMYSETCQ
jgi:hypothetical protein